MRQGTSTSGAYTAGKADFAPYGEWGKAKESTPLEKYKLKINLSKGYFQKTRTHNVGMTVKLNKCDLSNSSEAWVDENKIMTINSGTKGKILRVKVFEIYGGRKLTRYFIEVKGKKGWVHDYNILSSVNSD